MSKKHLCGCRILVVEDEYLIAIDLSDGLRAAGAELVGPLATVADAAACAGRDDPLDAAVLDVNLRGEMIFPVADALAARGVPFVFATGYDGAALPDRYGAVPRLEKPVKAQRLVDSLRQLLHPA